VLIAQVAGLLKSPIQRMAVVLAPWRKAWRRCPGRGTAEAEAAAA
jgi:hypothetical protein